MIKVKLDNFFLYVISKLISNLFHINFRLMKLSFMEGIIRGTIGDHIFDERVLRFLSSVRKLLNVCSSLQCSFGDYKTPQTF